MPANTVHNGNDHPQNRERMTTSLYDLKMALKIHLPQIIGSLRLQLAAEADASAIPLDLCNPGAWVWL